MILRRLSNEPLRVWETPVRFPATPDLAQVHPLVVEVGPGRGDFLYHLAAQHRSGTVAAIEIKRKRVDRLVKRLQDRGIDNVVLIQSDARSALPQFFSPDSIDEIHINFPDPWPKKRHTKNRLMTESFLRACAERLKPGGTLHFATDQDWYAESVRDLFTKNGSFKASHPECIVIDPPDAFPTLFMQKWREMGRTLYYQKYTRVI